jgi:hypothetical protein
MPRSIRNFWLSAHIDGRRQAIASGPRARDGGFRLDIRMREGGDISQDVLHVCGTSADGVVRLSVFENDRAVYLKESAR